MTEEEKRPYKEKANIIRQQFKEENPNYHYQKASEKQKKKRNQTHTIAPRDSFNFNTLEHANSNNTPNINLNSPLSLEFQLKNMFSSLGQQVVLRYITRNNTESEGAIKNSQISINETLDNSINDINAPVLNQ